MQQTEAQRASWLMNLLLGGSLILLSTGGTSPTHPLLFPITLPLAHTSVVHLLIHPPMQTDATPEA